LAIQYIYGANMNFRTGDNVYVLKVVVTAAVSVC